MAGELLESADLTESGIAGDRTIQVRNAAGKMMTARTRPLLLRHHAATGANGQILVDDRHWDSESVARDVVAAAGPGTRLVYDDTLNRFDVLPLLVTTDGMLEAVGHDRRRFRPNLVIGGVSALKEREWEGARLQIGSAVIGMDDLRARCIMTTFDPDTGAQDLNVLRGVQKKFDGTLGLNSFVIVPGRISTGDTVTLLKAA